MNKSRRRIRITKRLQSQKGKRTVHSIRAPDAERPKRKDIEYLQKKKKHTIHTAKLKKQRGFKMSKIKDAKKDRKEARASDMQGSEPRGAQLCVS